MGRKNKSYSKTLHQQAYEKLTSMQAFGESKKEAVKDGTDKEKIRKYSISHVPTVISIVKKSLCNTYTNLSGKVCLDTKGF